MENTSGQGAASVVPEEVKGWSWGAFLLTWIWGIFNGVWVSLLMFVPFVNLVMWFVLAAKGREWAWRNKKWDSVEHFKETQKTWAIVGVVIASIGIILIPILMALTLLTLNVAREKARDSFRMADVQKILTAVEYYYEDHRVYPSDITDTILGPYFESGEVPRDRYTGIPYGYGMNRATNQYQVYAALETTSLYLEEDADVDASTWSPNPGVNGVDCDSANCKTYIFDLSN